MRFGWQLFLLTCVAGCVNSLHRSQPTSASTAAAVLGSQSQSSSTAPTSESTPSTQTPGGGSILVSQTPGQVLSGLVLRGVWVIDDHFIDALGWTANGNCNALPDAGETVELALDVFNNGALPVGPFAFQLMSDAPTSEVKLPIYIATGAFVPIQPGKNWIQSIRGSRPDPVWRPLVGSSGVSNSYAGNYGLGLAGVKFTDIAHGTYNFRLVANLLDVNNNSISSVTFYFGLTVGQVPTSPTACPGTDQVVWP